MLGIILQSVSLYFLLPTDYWPLLTEDLVVVLFDLRAELHVVDQEPALLPLLQPDLLVAEGDGEEAEQEGVAAGDDGQHVTPADTAGPQTEVVSLQTSVTWHQWRDIT